MPIKSTRPPWHQGSRYSVRLQDTTCSHHWILGDAITRGKVAGVCKLCGAEQLFRAPQNPKPPSVRSKRTAQSWQKRRWRTREGLARR